MTYERFLVYDEVKMAEAARKIPVSTASQPATEQTPETPERLRLKYGQKWRQHVVPKPAAFSTKSGIGDLVPGAQNDTPPEKRGANSRALACRIASSCAGHASPPTPLELYDAIHTKHPTARSAAVLRTWMTEATADELVRGWIDHCYTWRELSEGCQRHFIHDAPNADIMNRMRQEDPKLGTCRECGTEPADRRTGEGVPVCTECTQRR